MIPAIPPEALQLSLENQLKFEQISREVDRASDTRELKRMLKLTTHQNMVYKQTLTWSLKALSSPCDS